MQGICLPISGSLTLLSVWVPGCGNAATIVARLGAAAVGSLDMNITVGIDLICGDFMTTDGEKVLHLSKLLEVL